MGTFRSFGFLSLAGLFTLFRIWQGFGDFEKQQSVFSGPVSGVFQARILEEPEVIFPHENGRHDVGRLQGFYQPFVREARAVCEMTAWNGKPLPPVKARITFRLAPEDFQPILSYGDLVEFRGKLLAPPPVMNPGQFDYAHFLKTKNVAYVSYAAPGKWRRLGPAANGGNFLIRWSSFLRRWTEESIYGFLPFPENALLAGLLLGERGPLPGGMVETFMVTGTVHILAVSGMMTAFIAGILFLALRAFQVPRKWAAGLSVVGVIFFILMTGAHPPVCRAGLFSILALAAVLFERKINGGVLLGVTAVILVLVNPLVLEDLSFQISFLATAGLMVFSAGLLEKLSFLWKPAALLVTSTLAAQLSVWCLLIFVFNQLSFYSPVANLLIVPLALFAAAAGLTAIAGSLIHPLLGKIFGAACWVPLKLLILLADKIALWPGAALVVASPPGLWVVLFHIWLAALFLAHWPSRRPEAPAEDWKRKQTFRLKWQKMVLKMGAVFFLASLFFFIFTAFRPQPLRLTFLSVGHGNAVVLRTPQGRVFVFDGGKETDGPDRYNPVVAYLRHLGIQKVAGILDTHPDADHVGGLLNLLSAYPVEEAVVSPEAKADTGVYRRFEQAVQNKGVTLLKLHEGDRLHHLEPVLVEILHPPEGFQPRIHADNNLSVVSLVSDGGLTALLPGDLEKEGLLRLLKDNQPFPKVDWLMAPHHGRASGEPALCAEGLRPRFVVMSDWKDYPEARAEYQAGSPGSVVLSTAEEGAIEVEMGEEGKGRYRTFRKGDWRAF